MILESIVTTRNQDGSPNVSPMGPLVQPDFGKVSSGDPFLLRPFQTSTTYQNLKRLGQGVLHITDNVTVFVAGALRDDTSQPALEPAQVIEGFVLKDCCRYFEFEVVDLDDSEERTEISCRTVFSNELRPFWGFNRAKHAVLEAAILATRVHLLDHDEIRRSVERLQVIVHKTAGPDERRAFDQLQDFFAKTLD